MEYVTGGHIRNRARPDVDMNGLKSALRDNGFVLPDYENSNLSVLKGTINRKRLRGAKKKSIFLVVDGLGYDLVESLLVKGADAGLLGDARVEKKSTVFPSTTTAVITSFETGRTPAEHGLIGWDIYYKELGLIITPYRDSAAFSKSVKLGPNGIGIVFPKPRLFTKASSKGRILIVNPEELDSGGLSTSGIANCVHEQYSGSADLFLHLRDAVRKNEAWFIYAYYSGLDHLEHLYGFTSEQAKYQVTSFFSELNRILLPELDGSDYELIVTADHGQIEVKKKILLNGRSRIMQYLALPPWGDMRMLCMSALPGKEAALTRQFEKDYGNDAIIVDSESLIGTGIFGKTEVGDDVRPRFGTHIALAKGNAALHYEYPIAGRTKRQYRFKGTHSGLSRYEMEVPVITYL